jgi:hypothetical protein
MSEPRLSDMSEAEFEGHIERIANSDHELPADVFVDLLLARLEALEKRHSAGSQTNNDVFASGHPDRGGRRTRRLQ